MTGKHELDGFDMAPASLEREWVVTIDTPTRGVEPVLEALGRKLPLVQGPYDNCMYVRENGYQRFRALEALSRRCRRYNSEDPSLSDRLFNSAR